MNNSNLPILYSFRRCPYAMRARLAVASSGQQCQLREIVLRDKAEEFLAVSPSATVPALKDANGEVLDESLDIMIWALKRHDPEGWLSPDTGSLEAMLALIEEADGDFKTSLDRYKYSNRYEGADSVAERTKASVFLKQLDEQLSASSYLFGERITLADMAIAPFVRQFANVDRDWFDAQAWPHLLVWLNEFLESKRFASIMSKYTKWQPEDDAIYFPVS